MDFLTLKYYFFFIQGNKILLNTHMRDILLFKLILSIIYVCFVHALCVYICLQKYKFFPLKSKCKMQLTPISWESVTNVF